GVRRDRCGRRARAGRDGAIAADLHANTAALHLELLHVLGTEALQQLRGERVRVGSDLLRIGYAALHRRRTSAALWPPNPIELESDTSTCFLRAAFGM